MEQEGLAKLLWNPRVSMISFEVLHPTTARDDRFTRDAWWLLMGNLELDADVDMVSQIPNY